MTPNQIRISTRVRFGTVRDARGEQGRGIAALRDVLASRGDRYLLLVDAGTELSDRWAERMLVDSEWATNVCAVYEPGRTLFSLSRIPLDIQPPVEAASVDAALGTMFDQLQPRARHRARTAGVGVLRLPSAVRRSVSSSSRKATRVSVARHSRAFTPGISASIIMP